jgi:predicted AAA+ superfamily ATPase
LKRTGVNLLGGRVLLKKMHPFMAAEIKNYFNIEKAITHGMLPVVLDSKYPEEVLKSYAALYLKEEVQAEGLTRNLGNFARFLEIISFSHGSMLNISNVARECEIHRKVVESYITILEDLLIASRIDVFSRRAKRALTSHAKFYIFDAGVFASLRPSGPFDHPQDIQGASLEGLVFQHLLAYKDYAQGKNEIYYWRTRSGVEVDFIVYGACGLWGIEVKNTERIRTEDLKPLKIYSQEYPESKLIFLYRGKQRMQIENILVVPCEEFLLQLYPGRLSENL